MVFYKISHVCNLKQNNNIDSTQDLRSDITKADSVVIESENYHQTACTSKDQGRRT